MRKYILAFCLPAFFILPLSFSCFAAAQPEAGSYSVQVSACRKKVSADGDISRLLKEGYHPYIFETTDSGGGTWYLVRIGDYPSLKEAGAVADAYERKEGKDAVVTPSNSLRVLMRPGPGPARVAVNEPKPEVAPVNEGAAGEKGGAQVTDGKTASVTERKVPGQSSRKGNGDVTAAPEAPVRVAAGVTPAPNRPENKGEETSGEKKSESHGAVKPGELGSPSFKQLEERVKTIEKELKRMREQAEVRKKLEITTKEKAQKEKEVLSAAGRQYTLLSKGTLGAEYNFSYAYYSYDVLREAARIEHHSNHNLTNALYLEYALFNNLTFNSNIPFAYKYDRSGTSQSKDVNDLGDVSVGVQWQPVKSGGKFPSAIFQGTFTLPSGRSPYDINPEQELSTGSGYYSAGAGVTLSQTIDPVVAFGSLNYSHNFNIHSLDQHYSSGRVLTGVDPGDDVSLNLGIGYALSYKVSLNLSYQYSYYFSTSYRWENAGTTSAAAYASSIFSIGTGWRISPERSIYLKLGIGLTNDDPDFLFSVRIPFQFQM